MYINDGIKNLRKLNSKSKEATSKEVFHRVFTDTQVPRDGDMTKGCFPATYTFVEKSADHHGMNGGTGERLGGFNDWRVERLRLSLIHI